MAAWVEVERIPHNLNLKKSGKDGVHPTAAGAKELWKEVKRELTE